MGNYRMIYRKKNSNVFHVVVLPSDTSENAYASFKEKYPGRIMVKIERA